MCIQASFQSQNVASFVLGASLSVIALQNLYNNQVGTLAQITLIALPILQILRKALSSPGAPLKDRIISQSVIAYFFGFCVVFLGNAIYTKNASSLCNIYSTCLNHELLHIDICKDIFNTCHQDLIVREWHHLVGAFNEKNNAIIKLCASLLKSEVDENAKISEDTRQLLLTLKQELYNLTKCHPDIDNNAYYKIMTPVGLDLVLIGAWLGTVAALIRWMSLQLTK